MLTRRSFGSIGFVSLISLDAPCKGPSASRTPDVAGRPSAAHGPPSHLSGMWITLCIRR